MTEKEIGELRRRLRPDRTNITSVYGCYVSDSREILSSFRQSLSICTEDDKELYLGLLKKALSGSIDKNLLDLTFRTQQVADSDEHRLLILPDRDRFALHRGALSHPAGPREL